MQIREESHKKTGADRSVIDGLCRSTNASELLMRIRRRKRRKYTVLIIALLVYVASCLVSGIIGYKISGDINKETAVDVDRPDIAEAEPASNIPPPQETADIIEIINASRIAGMTKRCYLTFDDGPSTKVTGEVLDILAKHNIKATFFQTGSNIRKYPDITRRVYDEGHLVANHSYSHNYDLLYETESSFKTEILECEQAIAEATEHEVSFKLVRFPGGSYNAGNHAEEKQAYKQTLADMGYYYCDWNTWNGDAQSAAKPAAELFDTFKTSSAYYIANEKNCIVLMHDTNAKQTTADSLEDIITYMTDNGYTFHRLDDITL